MVLAEEQIPFETPIFFCAGEPSGDLYAGLFIRELKKNSPHVRIFGVGGPRMRHSGAELLFKYERMMTFGLSNGPGSFLDNYFMYKKIARKMRAVNPRIFVAVAYPGINLLLCRLAKKMGMRVYYLLPPQIWAWGAFRKYFVKKWVDLVVSFFPFEADFYRRCGIKTVLVDNPLVSELRHYTRNDYRKRIGFMPGSRPSQVRRNLPVVQELIGSIKAHDARIECCLIVYDPKENYTLHAELKDTRICHENQYQVMKNCDLLVTGSGTASLQAAVMEIPQVFFHRLSYVDDFILRRFVHTREINLPNLYYEQAFVPCFVTSNYRFLVRELRSWVLSHI
jgi:lipid-A-disaccharide synthase